ncbi:Plastin-3 [Fasciola gigantica]|uniref:Plastin-3 n=1 Tax=Fasciola gigantica TaxID=46835 RepID=A0A504YD53_FASGI|nr:Plastin-3 [Fasciola gigantica]
MERKSEPVKDNLSGLLRTFGAVVTFYFCLSCQYDSHHSGRLEKKNLLPALHQLDLRVSEDELNSAIKAAEIGDHVINFSLTDFKRIYQELCKHDPRLTTIENVSTKSHLFQYGSSSTSVVDDTLHSVSEDEQIAFSSWMERNLKDDPTCEEYFPFLDDGGDLYTKCSDGILLCKIINCSSPGTIDQRAMNISKNLTTFQMHENITLALNSARAIGCNVVNIGAGDILNGTKHLLLGLLWQIIKIGLLKQINVVAHAELATLLDGDETISDFAKLSPEDILIRWVNYHLQGTESDTRMHNFTMDIRNCEVYAYLVEKIAPPEKKQFMHSARAILDAVDLVQRAEMVLQNAEQLDCRVFVRPQDIVSGSQRLNLAFLANLFHGYPALDKPPHVEEKVAEIGETREEKTYRNWINSMGITPVVNYLYSDLTDGIVLLKLFDVIKRDTVDWTQVHSELCPTAAKANFQKLENCNQVILLGRRSGFSLVGVAGADLSEGKRIMTLALLWQLMKAYTLSLLSRLTRVQTKNTVGKPSKVLTLTAEDEIISWANEKMKQAGKSSRISLAHGFSDPNLVSGITVIDLIDAIRPGMVDYNVVLPGKSKQEQLANAQYAIPLARKIGAPVYAVPEDIVELKSKMIMTIFACLMISDLEKRPGTNPSKQSINSTESQEVSYKRHCNSTETNNQRSTSASKAPQKTNILKEDGTKVDEDSEKMESVTLTVPILKRPSAEKVYKKTLNFTLSESGRCLSPVRSTVYTRSGPAGDCVSKRDQSPVQPYRSREVRGYAEKPPLRDRFFSPFRPTVGAGERPTSRTHSQSPSRKDYASLSKSTPSINMVDQNNLDTRGRPRTGRHHTIYKDHDFEDVTELSHPEPLTDFKESFKDSSGRVSWKRFTHKQEERISTWRHEGHSHRSHGGGRLFLAAQSRK